MAKASGSKADLIVQRLKDARRSEKQSAAVSDILKHPMSSPEEAKAILIHLAKSSLHDPQSIDIVLLSWNLLTGFNECKGIGARRSSYKERSGYTRDITNLNHDEEKYYGVIADYCTVILNTPDASDIFIQDACSKYIANGVAVLQTLSFESADDVENPNNLSEPEKNATNSRTESEAAKPKTSQPTMPSKRKQRPKRKMKPLATFLFYFIPVATVLILLTVALNQPEQTESQSPSPDYMSNLTTTDDLLAVLERDIEAAEIRDDYISQVEELAKSGSAESQYQLGLIYYLESDFDKAATYLSLSAQQGFVKAKAELALLHLTNLISSPDYDLAYSLANDAAKANYDIGQFLLGRCYHLGTGTAVDYSAAAHWYQLAADQGNPMAKGDLALLYIFGDGVEQDYSRALNLLKDAYSDGYTLAAYFIAYMYENGLGIGQNIESALEWYRVAADSDYVQACVPLGYYYDTGKGVEQDYSEAYKWYKKAADQNDPTAQYLLSRLYFHGLGVEQSDSEGIYWLKRSAENGEAISQKQLAFYYLNGEYVGQDYRAAVEWLRRAAEQGDEEAQKYLNQLQE